LHFSGVRSNGSKFRWGTLYFAALAIGQQYIHGKCNLSSTIEDEGSPVFYLGVYPFGNPPYYLTFVLYVLKIGRNDCS